MAFTSQGTVMLELPLRTVSINRRGRLQEQMKRAREHRMVCAMKLRPLLILACPPYVVTLTRLAVGRVELDDDNLRPALKHVRDGVADALGFDDSARAPIAWRYAQEVGRREYAVRIEVAWGGDGGGA